MKKMTPGLTTQKHRGSALRVARGKRHAAQRGTERAADGREGDTRPAGRPPQGKRLPPPAAAWRLRAPPSPRPSRNTRGPQADGDAAGGPGPRQRTRRRTAPLGHGHVPHLPRVPGAVPCPGQSSRGGRGVAKRPLTSGSSRKVLATLGQINPF